MRKRGRPPLPPYIRRDGRTTPAQRASDRRRYQTIFAAREGSAAAPTAGLHFTAGVMKRLEMRGVKTAYVTLHVGPGTFRPLREEMIGDVTVPSEQAYVPAATRRALSAARRKGGRVIAVGTTVTRTLEHFHSRRVVTGRGWMEVDLTIRPGHRFRAVDAMLTNFHLPQSSLLMLVSAFAGRERILSLYRRALRSGYRFYSYGDAMLIL
jgi:S-adenosylmethionine:tRNA ribosyltransferase-isomerase